jgi:hypothetical protein
MITLLQSGLTVGELLEYLAARSGEVAWSGRSQVVGAGCQEARTPRLKT